MTDKLVDTILSEYQDCDIDSDDMDLNIDDILAEAVEDDGIDHDNIDIDQILKEEFPSNPKIEDTKS